MAGLEGGATRGEIDAAVIMGGNLWGATPDTAFATRAMDAIGFKLFLTTTLNRGHVHGLGDGEAMILPVTARDEEWSPTTQESMFNFVRLLRRRHRAARQCAARDGDPLRSRRAAAAELARSRSRASRSIAKSARSIADDRAGHGAARRYRCGQERVPHPQPRAARARASARPTARRISSSRRCPSAPAGR